MQHNSFGQLFSVTSFGESHGPAIGVVIDGCPAGIPFDFEYLGLQLSRRRPGQSKFTTSRNEADEAEVLSGLFDGKSTGHPITILIPNKDARPKDYDALKNLYRPSHADFTYEKKYGIRDHRGGGRSSARVTAGWVAAGAVAAMMLRHFHPIKVSAFVAEIHNIACPLNPEELQLDQRWEWPLRCPHEPTHRLMEAAISEARAAQNSLGGVINTLIQGVPAGWGEPVFSKLSADLAHAMFSINAVKGFELGGGFEMSRKKGSEVNDAWQNKDGKAELSSNFSGGIQGGISNGMDIFFRTAFKPTATIGKPQTALNKEGEIAELQASGRHDPCVLPRAVPIVEAMSWLVLANHFLNQRAYQYA